MKVKATAAKAMTKGALVKAVAEKHELKTKACSEIIDSLVEIATTEVKKTGIFTLPGLCRLKLRTKPATKAVAEKHELKTKACSEIIDSLVEIATTEVKKTGIF